MSDQWTSSYRRDVMKALGAGAIMTGLSQTGTAQEDDNGNDGTESENGEMVTDSTGTVHTVQTLISGPPTNPERPADFFYQPTGLHVRPGDVVKFVFTTPDHNAVSMHPAFGMRRRVPLRVSAFSSPLLGWRPESIAGNQIEPPMEMGDGGEEQPGNGESSEDGGTENGDTDGDGTAEDGGPVPDMWLKLFETPGVYDMICSPHEGFGMAMRVVVGEETDTQFETSDPTNLPEPRAGPVGLARVTLTDPALEPSNIVEQGTVLWEDLEANQTGESSNSG